MVSTSDHGVCLITQNEVISVKLEAHAHIGEKMSQESMAFIALKLSFKRQKIF